MTYTDYISNALQLIGVLDENQSPSAEQGSGGMTVLNDMMANWEAQGINLGHVPTDTASTTIVYPQTSRNAIKANLALLLCPIYDRQPPAIVVAMAMAGWNRLMGEAIYRDTPATSTATMSSPHSTSFIESGP